MGRAQDGHALKAEKRSSVLTELQPFHHGEKNGITVKDYFTPAVQCVRCPARGIAG